MCQFGLLMVQACRRTCTIKQGDGTGGGWGDVSSCTLATLYWLQAVESTLSLFDP